jgi:alpha-maltose-1-phosphate synthase
MKVLYILPYDWGAMPQYTSQLANAISKYDDVYVIGSKNINKSYFNSNIHIIDIFDPITFSDSYIKTFFNIKNIINLFSFYKVKIIYKINPDIVHLTTPLIPPLSIFLYYYKIDRKYPLIHTKHGISTDRHLKNKIFELLSNKLENILKFKKTIVHTEVDKKRLITEYNKNESRIIVIPHGVYSLFVDKQKIKSSEKNCILFFGRIYDYKGIQYLLEAIPIILKRIPTIKVIIAGEGDLSPYNDLLERIDKRNISIYNGYIPDYKVNDLFQIAEILVLPYSSMSGQSGVLNIAYAFNKPIIATNVGGFNEIIENNVTGILVPPKDPLALAESIIKLLTDDNLKISMINNIKEKSIKYSWDTIANSYIELYLDIVHRNNTP